MKGVCASNRKAKDGVLKRHSQSKVSIYSASTELTSYVFNHSMSSGLMLESVIK